MITPTAEQAGGITAISDWFKNSGKPFFYLAGYAGSGKTTMARLAVEACGLDPDDYIQVLYAAYTGKAAMVMNRKGLNANTVHSLIYKLLELKGADKKPVFGLNPDSPLKYASLLVLDECSMIGEEIARDLISFGTKILVLGDPGQLPPIKSGGYFTERKPDYFLTEIHRQALESAIIRLAHDVRQGGSVPFGDHGDVLKLRLDEISDEDMIDHDQILTGTHNTRRDLNRHFLQHEGFDVDIPYQPGVKVLCCRNNADYGIFNGMIGRTSSMADRDDIDDDERFFYQSVHVEEGIGDGYEDTGRMRMNFGEFERHWRDPSDEEEAHDALMLSRPSLYNGSDHIQQMSWDFGYAITVHKSQGSQWPATLLFDDNHLNWLPKDRARLIYTAMTRASDHLTIVTP